MDSELKELLSEYTDDLAAVQTMSYYDYTKAGSKKVSFLLDTYHLIWYHKDPGTMYMVYRESDR